MVDRTPGPAPEVLAETDLDQASGGISLITPAVQSAPPVKLAPSDPDSIVTGAGVGGGPHVRAAGTDGGGVR